MRRPARVGVPLMRQPVAEPPVAEAFTEVLDSPIHHHRRHPVHVDLPPQKIVRREAVPSAGGRSRSEAGVGKPARASRATSARAGSGMSGRELTALEPEVSGPGNRVRRDRLKGCQRRRWIRVGAMSMAFTRMTDPLRVAQRLRSDSLPLSRDWCRLTSSEASASTPRPPGHPRRRTRYTEDGRHSRSRRNRTVAGRAERAAVISK